MASATPGLLLPPHAGSEIGRIDQLCFVAGYLKRRLNQDLSLLSLSLGFLNVLCC